MPRPFPHLTSRQHAVVQTFRQLARRRAAERSVLLDGPHLIQEAVHASVRLTTVLVTTSFLDGASRTDRAMLTAAERDGAAIYEVSAGLLEAASPVRTPAGIVAIAEWAPHDLAALAAPPPALVVGLVDVQDPGNVGAVIRSADALGATGVVAIGDAADPGGWKALRGAMGSTFRLPVARASLDATIASAKEHGLSIVATVAGGDAIDLAQLDLRQPTLVLVGNEGGGLPSTIVAAADRRVTIPMRAGVNSINVSVTAAVVLYEATRQRRS